MMTTFILRFVMFSGILFLLYKLLFSHFSFFRLNRALLLSIPILSLLIPLLAPYFEAPSLATPTFLVLLPEITLGEAVKPGSETSAISNPYLLLYVLGTIAMLISVMVGLRKGWYLVKRSRPAFENVRLSEEATGPFAFFSNIVIPVRMAEEKDLSTVLAHERAHVAQHHGYDNLLYNLLCAAFWFNPIMHLLNRELKQVHECLADEAALKQSSKESYARLLLSHVFGSEVSFEAANPFFNSSLIKTRISMIYKTKTNTKMKGLYLALLPLLAAMTIISCQKTQDQQQSSEPPVEEKSQALGFDETDQPPLFAECDIEASKEEQMACFKKGIMNYMIENFKYPEKAYEESLEGKIFLQFVINTAGKVEQVDVLQNTFPEDANPSTVGEAQAYAVKLMVDLPEMLPAIKDGKKVAVQFTLPINMKLN